MNTKTTPKSLVAALLLSMAIAVVSGCSTARQIVTSARDSTRIEIRRRVEYIHDTVMVEIPAQLERRWTLAESSHLENDYADSDARINSDGSLFHSLATKPRRKPVPVERPIEYRDSIVYRDRLVEKRTTVEVLRPLSWWQQAQMKGFWLLVCLLLTVAVAVLVRKIWPVVGRFLPTVKRLFM